MVHFDTTFLITTPSLRATSCKSQQERINQQESTFLGIKGVFLFSYFFLLTFTYEASNRGLQQNTHWIQHLIVATYPVVAIFSCNQTDLTIKVGICCNFLAEGLTQ